MKIRDFSAWCMLSAAVFLVPQFAMAFKEENPTCEVSSSGTPNFGTCTITVSKTPCMLGGMQIKEVTTLCDQCGAGTGGTCQMTAADCAANKLSGLEPPSCKTQDEESCLDAIKNAKELAKALKDKEPELAAKQCGGIMQKANCTRLVNISMAKTGVNECFAELTNERPGASTPMASTTVAPIGTASTPMPGSYPGAVTVPIASTPISSSYSGPVTMPTPTTPSAASMPMFSSYPYPRTY